MCRMSACVLLTLLVCAMCFVPQRTEAQEAHENTIDAENRSNGSATSNSVASILKKAFRYVNLKQIVKNLESGRTTPGACILCKFTFTMVKYLIEYGEGKKDVGYAYSSVCQALLIDNVRICDGLVNTYIDELMPVMERTNLDVNEICGVLQGDECHVVPQDRHNWTLSIPAFSRLRKSMFYTPMLFRWSFIGRQKKKNLKVLQITDIHYDPDYQVGSNAVCGERFFCCHANSTGELKPGNEAGYWGDYRGCDAPFRLVEQTFKAIRFKHPDIDYVMWTGDIPPHDLWQQDKAKHGLLIEIINDLIDIYFHDLPIFPVIGNHESVPLNSFPDPDKEDKYSKNWLYKTVAKKWMKWLPEDKRSTVERAGYYSMRPKQGLKVISLNTNFGQNQNWWILLNLTDPGQQLEWLVEELLESEELGEMVHILGHVPPGSSDCYQLWSRKLNEIVNRFSHLIKGQFYGHTHNDEFNIIYEDISTPLPNSQYKHERMYRATNVAYIAPSITPYGGVNPGYRIYDVDGENFDILDHHTYYLNLTQANLDLDSKPLEFQLSYSMKKEYGMKSLAPSEFHKLVMRMRTPPRNEDRIGHQARKADELFQKFYHLFYNRSDYPAKDACREESCKYENLCRLLTGLANDSTYCKHFLL